MTTEEEAFLQQILEDRDRLYRETSKLKDKLSGYENFEKERASLKQQIDEKEKQIDKLGQTVTHLDQTVNKLQQQVQMLQRRIWGKSSERYINEDPLQRKLDFGGLDLLPEEIEMAEKAKEEIQKYKTQAQKQVKEKKPSCT